MEKQSKIEKVITASVGLVAVALSYILFEDGLASIALAIVWHGYQRTVNPDIPPPPPPKYDKNR